MSGDFFSYDLTTTVRAAERGEVCRFYRRIRLRPTVERRITEKDFRDLISLGAGAIAAAALPSRAWPRYTRFASGLRYRTHHRKQYAGFEHTMRNVLEIDDKKLIQNLFRAHVEMAQRRRMMFMIDRLASRCIPPIDCEGGETLRAALDLGQGAIVWGSQFHYQTLWGKRALWEQGFQPIQISVGNHGFSDSTFGNRVINQPLKDSEDRYLKRRIVFDRDGGVAVTRKILGLLDLGELILLTNNVYAGASFVEVPFGARGVVHLATAPLSIVARRGTPFYSMAIMETKPLQSLQAVLAPIEDLGNDVSGRRPSGRDFPRMARLALSARDNIFAAFRTAPEQYLIPNALGDSWFEAT